MAPYARHPTTFAYVDERGLDTLRNVLELVQAPLGANVAVRIPDDEGVLRDAALVADNIYATSPVQTFLDLAHAGERGVEAAQHLRRTLLSHWKLPAA